MRINGIEINKLKVVRLGRSSALIQQKEIGR